MKKTINLLIMALALTPWISIVNAEQQQQIEPEAVKVLKNLSNTIATAKSLSLTMILGYEVTQDDGQKVEFGALRHIAMQRPNKLLMEFESREGQAGKMLFNGKDIIVYNNNENVYAQSPQPGDVSKAVEHLTAELNFPIPMKELFSENIADTLSANAQSAYIVGESKIMGVMTDHLALRSEAVDYQLWISKAQPKVLHRIVITYRSEIGQPQFWANLTNWDFNSDLTNKFNYSPPANAERVDIIVEEDVIDDKQGEEG